ncbi:DUF2125 domain-containing protein [Pseudoroseicyclus sp. CXY001]|uniref:DUF2125 domain-containing protein n=1 Tax=Pseudoroseicyclus sp. CXY001 TaxID=3242492 RepID=UPI003571239B
MRFLTWLVLGLAVLWGGYWAVGQYGVKRAAGALQENLAAEGVALEWSELDLRGFPSRFDTTLSAVSLVDPEAGIAWRAPFLQVMALSYRPTSVIAAFSPVQTIETPLGTAEILSEGLRASAGIRAALAVPLDHATAEAEWLRVAAETPAGGWVAEARDVLLAFREAEPGDGGEEESPAAYDIYAAAAPLLLPEPLLAALDPEGRMPAEVTRLSLDATLGLSGPVAARVDAEPELERVELRRAELVWGEMVLEGSGAFSIRPDGRPEGRIDLTLTDWQTALDLAIDAGLLSPEIRGTVELAAGTMEGEDGRLAVPVVFTEGRMGIGPLPALAPAPVLVAR